MKLKPATTIAFATLVLSACAGDMRMGGPRAVATLEPTKGNTTSGSVEGRENTQRWLAVAVDQDSLGRWSPAEVWCNEGRFRRVGSGNGFFPLRCLGGPFFRVRML